ncbi:hypothetical protein V144x_31910 [Gimesia aquarii]|uniref:Glycosyltransferase RgtA/B/C/D-like domain-containing protein n=2 Tax=Gimesia aquarii TaxID=2527964 RepID=A0A517VXH8_9PLAN|nr:hypothetical protein V144x_31910 [Gimesia aquarii]
MVAGVYHWKTGKVDLYEVNPPLLRLIATIPVVLAQAHFLVEPSDIEDSLRPEYSLGRSFISWNSQHFQSLFVWSRWACIPFSVLGGIVVYLWGRELSGTAGGLVSLTLWCFSPSILAYGQLMACDLGASVLGLLASYSLSKWLDIPSWHRTFVAGGLLGLALLGKLTWIVLLPLWPILWLIIRWIAGKQNFRAELPKMVTIIIVAVITLNVGYGFKGTGTPLGKIKFVSHFFGGKETALTAIPSVDQNTFSNSFIAGVPIPFPISFVIGLDKQKFDFEQRNFSYLRGEWRSPGWWWYYLYALLVKETSGLWLMFIVATIFALFAGGPPTTKLLLVISPALAVLVIVSSQIGMNAHYRYVIPILPFVFIFASTWVRLLFVDKLSKKYPQNLDRGSQSIFRLAGIFILCAAILNHICSSLYLSPHTLAYFNEVAGGPRHGHEHLLGTNISVGQDLAALEEWCSNHPKAGPFIAAIDSPVPKRHWKVPLVDNENLLASAHQQNVRPIWYAISVNQLWSRDRRFVFLRHQTPFARVGDATLVFRPPQS